LKGSKSSLNVYPSLCITGIGDTTLQKHHSLEAEKIYTQFEFRAENVHVRSRDTCLE